MCVPESGLRYYEQQLENDYVAREHGYDSWEEYQESIKDDIGNAEYDAWKDARTIE